MSDDTIGAGTSTGPSGANGNSFRAKIKMHFSRSSPYNELQWVDEDGKIRGQVVVHGWDAGEPQRFHGHMSFYVWDTSDPSGNNRHHPLNIFWAVRDPLDPPSEHRQRSRIAFDHAYVDLLDSRLVMRSPNGQAWEIQVSDSGALTTRQATPLPAPGE